MYNGGGGGRKGNGKGNGKANAVVITMSELERIKDMC